MQQYWSHVHVDVQQLENSQTLDLQYFSDKYQQNNNLYWSHTFLASKWICIKLNIEEFKYNVIYIKPVVLCLVVNVNPQK